MCVPTAADNAYANAQLRRYEERMIEIAYRRKALLISINNCVTYIESEVHSSRSVQSVQMEIEWLKKALAKVAVEMGITMPDENKG